MSYDETLSVKQELDRFMKGLVRRNPGEEVFHQAVQEVATTIIPYVHDKPHYRKARILERMTEPDRVIGLPRVC